VFNKYLFVSVGEECAFEVCLSASLPQHALVCAAEWFWCECIWFLLDQNRLEEMLQEYTEHVPLTDGQPVHGIRCFSHG